MLCIRDQKLAPPAFRDAMAQFGTPMLRKQLDRTPECAEVNIISSEDRDVLGDGAQDRERRQLAHRRQLHARACSLTMLYGVVVPSRGGDTQFTNMYAAYEDLPAETKARIDPSKGDPQVPVRAASSAASRRARPTRWRQCRRRRIRWCAPIRRRGASRSISIPTAWSRSSGWTAAESDRLLDELIAMRRSRNTEYRHVWRQGDIVIWDNRCTDAQAPTPTIPKASAG